MSVSSDNTKCISKDDSSDSIGGGCITDLSGDNRELLPLDKAKSAVWEYSNSLRKMATSQRKTKRKEKFIVLKKESTTRETQQT